MSRSRRTSRYPQPYMFAGAYYDDNTGFYKMGARYYDQAVGRFTQPDPVAGSPYVPTSYNAYIYVRSDPVNRIDPTGFQEEEYRTSRLLAAGLLGFLIMGVGTVEIIFGLVEMGITAPTVVLTVPGAVAVGHGATIFSLGFWVTAQAAGKWWYQCRQGQSPLLGPW